MDAALGFDDDAPAVADTFEDFFRMHFGAVARAAALVSRDREVGQELAQDAFIRLYERWGRMASTDHARNFVFKVAINLGRSYRRRYRRIIAADLDPSGPTPGPEDGTLLSDWREVVDALSELSSRQRSCVVLVDYVDLDAAAAGRVLGIRPETVRVHLMRGREAIRRRLGPTSDGGRDE